MTEQTERLLLGITGGIAAYKAAYLVRQLRKTGTSVRVVMTPAAQKFITPMTLQALSGQAVRCDLLDPQAEAGMDHIELARWAQRLLIAPASADFIARIAHGLANDLLSTLCLATTAPIVIAPAMNHSMWQHPATQANINLLRTRGVLVLGPEIGVQACGEIGPGRMLEPTEIVAALQPKSSVLKGIKVLITAGPTREPIDPVRYISNRSSGRMGYALTQALIDLGAEVCLISGPVVIAPPHDAKLIKFIKVETAVDMAQAVQAHVGDCQIFIATAAVADYRIATPFISKLKKNDAEINLQLVKNPDILATVAALPRPPFTVGFAAETQDLETQAWDKLQRKKLAMIAANIVGDGVGFESNINELLVLWQGGGRVELAQQPKESLARHLASLIAERYWHQYQSTS